MHVFLPFQFYFLYYFSTFASTSTYFEIYFILPIPTTFSCLSQSHFLSDINLTLKNSLSLYLSRPPFVCLLILSMCRKLTLQRSEVLENSSQNILILGTASWACLKNDQHLTQKNVYAIPFQKLVFLVSFYPKFLERKPKK